MSGQLSTLIAGLALVVSIVTAWNAYRHRKRESRAANPTAYFHWNQELSRVDVADDVVRVGYNLVVWNQGPAPARDVQLEVLSPRGDLVDLSSVEPDEFPLARIDSRGQYPIQFAPASAEYRSGDKRRVVRRFNVRLRWSDGNGPHEHVVPLRRGQTNM